ncbi:hypothetical protein MJO29_005868 [Puccinia striiformis f. sp. tritici]|uniref:hypothetical protein n=1 Tax=Puccinia striiformis f. sp. tritici TaxID=168172 RepID=UPI00200898D3|nr:hypothetical protein Pst134EA_011065 [Puccinia striiformis f. sp. tritici]KAH9467420.1 hypothetical protein Pst134EA_011065 [Puccinia striiformis f. sp. tritici]KAI7957651.1 hypothetical protein MJO29_005868 [Puccinia striiformis f. sp. tritici]
MSVADQIPGEPGFKIDRFGPALQHLPTISAKGFEVPYPLDDPLMSEQLDFFKSATMIQDSQELKAHILAIRDECCKAFPFPCILCFYFLQGMIVRHPYYPTVRQVIEQAPDTQNILLDIGAGMGTDLRQIISHGWNRDDALGMDITSDWDTLGYKLFRDSERPIPSFFGDILSLEVLNESTPVEVSPARIDLRSLESLNPLKGRVKFLILNQVFHLFDEARQKTLAERCALLLSHEPGSAIFGMQMGGYTKGFESKVFVHSPESWRELWDSIFGPNKVKVTAELVDLPTCQKNTLKSLFPTSRDIVRLYWSVTRL